jgi:uncharacterized protein (DUF779 family)
MHHKSEVIADNKSSKYSPLVEEKKTTSAGGSCESVPLCYSKDHHLTGSKIAIQ